jgi:hypothetical protein
MSRLLVTIAIGDEFRKLLTLTEPFFQAYALKYGATYLAVVGDSPLRWSMSEKFAIYHRASTFDKTLYVDADCWIKPECEDIFDFAETAMHDDLPFIQEKGFHSLEEYNSVMRSQQLPEVESLPRMLGAGVVLCSRETSGIWRRPFFPIPKTHCAEQCWVHYQAEQAGVTSLPSIYNWQGWFKGFRDGLEASRIVHLASVPERYEAMRNLINGSY